MMMMMKFEVERMVMMVMAAVEWVAHHRRLTLTTMRL